MSRITGSQARELLEGSSEGPWEASSVGATMNDQSQWRIGPRPVPQVARSVMRGVDARLIAAAPDLAETVAWLYGRAADHVGSDESTAYRGPMAVVDRPEVSRPRMGRVPGDHVTDHRHCPRCGFELAPRPAGGKRHIDTTVLAEVARVYLDAAHAPTEAVARTFGVKHRMASNYVAKAREQGLLPRTTQGRRSA